MGAKLLLRKVALDPPPLFALRVKDEYRRRPHGVEAMEVDGMFFDVRFEGQEILIDEGRDLIVGVGFGLQPNARASSRGGAEINQQRSVLRFRFTERRVGVLAPFD